MRFEINSLLYALMLCTVLLNLALFYIGWQRRHVPGGRWFALFMASTSWFTLMYIFELASCEATTKAFWRQMQYLVIPVLIVLLLLMILAYSERYTLTKRFAVLLVIPAFTTLFAITNDIHHLLWHSPRIEVVSDELQLLLFTPGPWYWIHVIYSYLLSLFTLGLLVYLLSTEQTQYRRGQMAMLLAGVGIIAIANIVGITDTAPIKADLTPFFMGAAGMLWAYAIFRYSLWDIPTIAHSTLIANMKEPLLVTDKDGSLLEFNSAAKRILPDLVIGEPLYKTLSELPVLHNLAKPSDASSKTRSAFEMKLMNDGSVCWYEVSIDSVYETHQHQRIGYMITLRDRTTQHQMLEQQEQEIQQLDFFAHTVAHNLKNPLQNIQFAAGLLADDDSLSQENYSIATQVLNSGRKMFAIIEEIMLLSGLNNEADFTPTALEMPDIIKSSVARLAYLMYEFEPEIIHQEEWPLIWGYEPWVEEALVNYISNAIKYGGTSSASAPRNIVVEIGADLEADGNVRIWVRDNGQGLTEEQQVRVFQPFTRLNQATIKGHGLGLAIVGHIVSKLGGEVRVESTLGEGCTFSFTVPSPATNEKIHP